MWHLYLPIAGNSVNVVLIFGMGAFVGLLSGIFGVGGGFLMTPLLIMAGIPPTVAAASDSNQIVGASTSGTLAHYRLGNVDFKMGILLLIGGVIGGTVGVQIIKILRQLEVDGEKIFSQQVTSAAPYHQTRSGRPILCVNLEIAHHAMNLFLLLSLLYLLRF